jgi:GNAT superfamily N-acetyltransferase
VGTFDVERMKASESDAAVVTLARSFHDDPLFNFLIPNHLSQARAALTFMRSAVADARPFGEIWVARSEAKVAGVAVWLPPGRYPRGARRETQYIARDMRSVPRLGRQFLVGTRLQTQMQRAHHRVEVPHWYLMVVGADPAFQRRGAGTALLAPVLAQCDEDGVPAYLETQKPENVPWYHRFGFEVAEQLDAGRAPPMWTMRREPR